ncbi:hypothetical protein J4Q44_G00236740 [Coregonus suidteri]|uniref:Uncharacterized protein n=1 Tax=Coregonus suidteri TaxID=861788 RepID=A0AAN8LCN8_9TELE
MVSFVSRIPVVFPTGDANSLSRSVVMYACNKNVDLAIQHGGPPACPTPPRPSGSGQARCPWAPLSQDPNAINSELILWRLDPVDPLSFSGGVSELARINSLHSSAFSNVAWLPTLIPSNCLGVYCNSPSACFVASDGHSLRLYQAVIEAKKQGRRLSCYMYLRRISFWAVIGQTTLRTSRYRHCLQPARLLCPLLPGSGRVYPDWQVPPAYVASATGSSPNHYGRDQRSA